MAGDCLPQSCTVYPYYPYPTNPIPITPYYPNIWPLDQVPDYTPVPPIAPIFPFYSVPMPAPLLSVDPIAKAAIAYLEALGYKVEPPI